MEILLSSLTVTVMGKVPRSDVLVGFRKRLGNFPEMKAEAEPKLSEDITPESPGSGSKRLGNLKVMPVPNLIMISLSSGSKYGGPRFYTMGTLGLTVVVFVL
jgi:hypothetical protein